MFDGYLTYGGAEVANNVRTAAYLRSLGLAFFMVPEDCETPGDILGPYTTPEEDDAPWLDANAPESAQFAGFWPLAIDGMENSTITRTITERITDGGVLGHARRAHREVVVRGALLGASEEAVTSGLFYLRSVLSGTFCDQGDVSTAAPCSGYDLGFLGLCPGQCSCSNETCDADCWDRWERWLYDVRLLEGPEMLRKGCVPGGFFQEVQFTLAAGNPYRWGNERDATKAAFAYTYSTVKSKFATYNALKVLNYTVPWTYADIWTYLWDTIGPPTLLVAADAMTLADILNADGPVVSPFAAPPLLDPDCPTPPTMPSVPQANVYCGSLWAGAWKRNTYRIQALDVPRWVDMLPIVTLYDAAHSHTDIRVRFAPDIGGDPDANYTSEFYVTYLPGATKMFLNGPRDRITVQRGYGAERADQLVIVDSRGSPIRWPVITCGGDWLIVVDVPSTDPNLASLKATIALVAREP